MSIRLFQCLLLSVIFQFFIPSVQASCLDVEQAANVNFNNTTPIIVPQGTPVGTVIYSTQVHAEYVATHTCTGYDTENDMLQGGNTGKHDENWSPVFSTNIKGIGYTFYVPGAGNFDNQRWGQVSDKQYFGPESDNYTLSFIVTSTDIGIGTIKSGLYAYRKVAEHPGGPLQTLANIYVNGGNIVSACAVKGNNIAVDMGTVNDSEFTGPGSNSAEVIFKLKVNCPADSNVFATIEGTTDPDMTDGSVLALTPGEGNATGIGAQILYSSTPLKLNEKLYLKKGIGSEETMKFSARYIQTKPSITPGHANATGTLTITYE